MKLVSYLLIAVSLVAIISSVSAPTTSALSVPSRSYCIDIAPLPKAQMGVSVGCGYTYSECIKRLPSKLAAYKSQHPQYPKAVASCDRQ